MTSTTATPIPAGFRWPAEWESHAATWLAYPHNRETWPGKFELIPRQFEAFLRCVAEHERVCLLASPDNIDLATRRRLESLANVELIDIPTNDAWIRDYGPTFLRGSGDARAKAAVVWRYNAWGGKYPPFDLDNAAADRVAAAAGVPVYQGPLTLEGGAIDGNGRGTVLTTASCLLDQARNPQHDQLAIEQALGQMLGATNILWLPESQLEGDDTDGHVDQLARFVAVDQIVVAAPSSDGDHSALQTNLEFLRNARSQDNDRFEVHALPLPSPSYFNGQRLPTSYCNSYFCNGAVIVPAFGDQRADDHAAGLFRELCPQRTIVSLNALDLAWGLGAFHCLTQPEF